ncbi:hypothetical protein DL93DRAFT_1934440 [Clavulina sp. PMI_390]|nr:hypothetical protein DL93DRAFT_1934440 [Clavulina sp. PMI_390]
MTYVQDNSVFYPQNMPGNMSGSRIRGFTILHCVEFFLWLLVMIPFWFPRFASRGFKVSEASAPAGFMGMLIVILGLAATVEFFMNFAIHVDNISSFNSIDNFYQPAQCGTTRPLKTGILLVARAGKMYNMMWVAWVMIYCVAGPVIVGRCIWIADNFEKSIRAADEKRAARDVERQAKQEEKDQKKFRAEVDKEKERIRSVALQELKAEESNKVEPSPPYLEVNIEKEK